MRVEEKIKERRKSEREGKELQFTGNWFIDAGILGFVNLMEEVYEWDLDELQDKLKDDSEIVYYAYFPFAYFYKLSGKENKAIKEKFIKFITKNQNLNGEKILEEIWWNFITKLFKERWTRERLEKMHESECFQKNGKLNSLFNDETYINLVKDREKMLNELVTNEEENLKKILEKRKLKNKKGHNLSLKDIEAIEKRLKEFTKNNKFYEIANKVIKKHKELEKYLNECWNKINPEKICEEKFYRIPVDSRFFKNFAFFNPSKGILSQLKELKNLIAGNTESKSLQTLNKDINKFLPSDNKFPNISYTPLRTKELVKRIPHLFVYLINFLNAFTEIKMKNDTMKVFFYSNDLRFAYLVNKKIKEYMNRVKGRNYSIILNVTWNAVIDTFTETESIWSLENMYLIKYKKIEKQDLIGVEYIGIPKLQASVIKDEVLRKHLNVELPVKVSNNEKQSIWMLMEFIKNNPLLPYLTQYVHIYLTDKIEEDRCPVGSLVYINMTDSKIKEFKRDEKVFSENFFERYKQIVEEIKSDAKWSFGIRKIFAELFENLDERKRYANLLLNIIKKGNKYHFVNTLLKIFTAKKDKNIDIKKLINFTFNKILFNDTSWKNYAFIFITGLLKGGEDEGK